MDPNATFADLLDALLSGDHEDAAIHADGLAIWIANGGFVPQALTDAKTKRTSEQPPRADIPQLIGAPITFKDGDGKVTGHAKVSEVEVNRLKPADIEASLEPLSLRAPIKNAVRLALKPLLGERYSEDAVRQALAAAFNEPELAPSLPNEKPDDVTSKG